MLFGARLDPLTGCWLLPGSAYVRTVLQGKKGQAHRLAWASVNGDIPPGVELDHMCRRRNCVRPEHMDPVTRSENQRRVTACIRRLIEVCPVGHNLVCFGIDTPEGGRICSICSEVKHG